MRSPEREQEIRRRLNLLTGTFAMSIDQWNQERSQLLADALYLSVALLEADERIEGLNALDDLEAKG